MTTETAERTRAADDMDALRHRVDLLEKVVAFQAETILALTIGGTLAADHILALGEKVRLILEAVNGHTVAINALNEHLPFVDYDDESSPPRLTLIGAEAGE